jgi:hypothetical protein
LTDGGNFEHGADQGDEAMSQVGRAAWKRFAALGLAGALAVAGLWLAVGAGASGGDSVRQAGYPQPGDYNYKTKIDGVDFRFGKIDSTHSRKVKFKFHVEAAPGYSLRFIHTECKRDRKHYKKCDSPKKYHDLSKGRHKFKVRAAYDNCQACDPASRADKYVWKVK